LNSETTWIGLGLKRIMVSEATPDKIQQIIEDEAKSDWLLVGKKTTDKSVSLIFKIYLKKEENDDNEISK